MLDRNIAEMASFAKAHKVNLRPHSKTHKSADIARRQIAAGALGVCCAKLGEAEALGEAGIESLHITSPVVTPQAIDRLMALNAKVKDLMVVVDHPANVDALAAAAAKAGKPQTVVVDIDPGMHRTGVASPDAVVELVKKVTGLKSLKYAGVQFYCGRHQHIVDFKERKAEIEERTEYLKGILAKLDAAGLKPGIVTGSGTGTHYIDAKLGVFTELQVGSYVFMDHDYNVCDLRGLDKPTFEQALQIDARVVSANTAGMVTVDAGLKAMATEKGPPMILKGAVEGSTTRFMGDEHLAVIAPEGKAAPGVGRAGDPDAAALRSHGQSLRELSRGEGRHAGRDLAGDGARPLALSRPAQQKKGPFRGTTPFRTFATRTTSETCPARCRSSRSPGGHANRSVYLPKDHRCRLRVSSDPGAAGPFGSSPRLKPVAEFGLLFKREPGSAVRCSLIFI